jgi:hypothetical protein
VTKSIIIILFIILAVLIGGCSYSDASAQKELRDSILTGNDVKRNLSDIEETFTSFDYDKVIKDYSDIIPENSTITKFRYFVVFSDMNDSTTFRLIDNDIRNTIDAMEKTYVSKKPLKPLRCFYSKILIHRRNLFLQIFLLKKMIFHNMVFIRFQRM